MVYTYEKKEIIEHLKLNKREILINMIEVFQETLKEKGDVEKFFQTLETLFDLFLLNISTNERLHMEMFGQVVEGYRNRKEISLEEFLYKFEQVRLTMEKSIARIPTVDTEKNETIAQLNKFFLELQKEAYIETEKQINNQLLTKEVQLSQLKKDRAEILSKLSTSFAHEIRNPLTSIKGFVQLLEKRLVSEKEEEKYFHFIYQDMEELEQQVNQFLMLSTEKNHQDLCVTAISLKELLYEVVDSFQPIISQGNICVHLHLCENVSTWGLQDQIKLVLYKLMQNAHDALMLKENGRKLKICLKKDQTDAIITFANNGPPVPRLIRHSMFEPFVGTKELGKGLGLAVSKQLMNKHKGDIDYVTSEEWTIFKLRFPIKQLTDDDHK
ncbi:hypothetical protein CR194_00875 [Salipaludibacillus keqinensis]|uniref:histidine kinase n=1 Tax=Salipaludibacillus keqinensis TaxID=2045207 RepID=A0A323TKD9_9BACI|nr:HAMP domain-containing sensor histidine kinase [Salipaludibacillus keqinensis]PYZ94127.1 hypothetical protein CR194_00875 [Salipaludibacillus keqinensis]